RASSNVFSMFEQSQIQEFKEAFTLIDQNRDGFIDKEDLKDTYASLGKLNVKDNEFEEMLREASGPINFTMFLNLFGEKLHGTDPEETILNAFRLFDPDARGFVHRDELQKLLMTQADRFTPEEVKQMFQSSNIDAAGNLDYKSLCYIITHGEEQDEVKSHVTKIRVRDETDDNKIITDGNFDLESLGFFLHTEKSEHLHDSL
uniref:EF-hand domain-containing protein n=1 Tax=Scophthalmus maximus TaxID=52904 RepID=A0A8D3BR42_SCOMX